MNFGEHSALAGAITILIYFIYPDWIQMSIIMLFIGAIIPDVMEPTKQNSFFEITSLFYNSFPNVSRGKEGYKHRGFFHSWFILLIISIATIVLFGLSLLWFNIFSWVFYFGLGYMSHLVSDSISYIYNTRNITAKEKYYTNFGLPKK